MRLINELSENSSPGDKFLKSSLVFLGGLCIADVSPRGTWYEYPVRRT